MADVIEKMVAQVRHSIGEPMVNDIASWCIGTLAESDRRDDVKILGAVYDWCRGAWRSTRDVQILAPEKLLTQSMADLFADAERIEKGARIIPRRPKRIAAGEYAAAVLAATMASTLGIKTRFRVWSNSTSWQRITAEADPLMYYELADLRTGEAAKKDDDGTVRDKDGRVLKQGEYGIVERNVWGYHMDLAGGLALREEPEYAKSGAVEIFPLVDKARNDEKPLALNAAPPGPGEQFMTFYPDSWEGGIKAQLERMRQTVRAQATDPLVVAFAQDIVSKMDAWQCDDPKARIDAVYERVTSTVRYRKDPYRMELLQTPHRLIRMAMLSPDVVGAAMAPVRAAREGVRLEEVAHESQEPKAYEDCDGQVTFIATVLSTDAIAKFDGRNRIDVRFDLGGTIGMDGMHHVYPEASIDGKWGCCRMDTTEPDKYQAVGEVGEMEKNGYMRIW